MDLVRDVCSATLSVRKANKRRVRLPLQTVTVATEGAERLEAFRDVIADEVNVRNVVLTSDVASIATEKLQLVPKALGPRLGKDVQNVIKAHKAGDWSVVDGVVTVGGVELQDGEYSLDLVADDSAGEGVASTGLGRAGGVVALDITLTEELEREGRARDLVRLVQQARREADLHVSDRITIEIVAEAAWIDAIADHRDLIAAETLAVDITATPGDVAEPQIMVARQSDT
jgi:isoleucyl-tRNA synthetase